MNCVLEYIEENLTNEINLTTMARFMRCSVWELGRLFSFITHISLGEYIRKRKLNAALVDIQSGKEKIIDIALKYGYDSPAAFSRAFSRQYGISPSKARSTKVVLTPYPKIQLQIIDDERVFDMNEKNDMLAYSERGYYVKENAPVYFTPDLDNTCKWFRDVLGWYGDVTARNSNGVAEYGCIFDYPGELIILGLTPFRGIHLFRGEAVKGVVGFIMIQGLERFREVVLQNGWSQISEIEHQHWGANECSITTIDGSIIRVFETVG